MYVVYDPGGSEAKVGVGAREGVRVEGTLPNADPEESELDPS